jgi:DNA-directed RNA polymerase specialized sigma24 family protein
MFNTPIGLVHLDNLRSRLELISRGSGDTLAVGATFSAYDAFCGYVRLMGGYKAADLVEETIERIYSEDEQRWNEDREP